MSKRDDIIMTAAQLIHEQGYHHIGIKSILDALQIPKGSFYHYFKSKEDLGLAVIDMYIEDLKGFIAEHDATLDSLNEFFDEHFGYLMEQDFKKGCPVGNLILELSDDQEVFREKLMEWYEAFEMWIAAILASRSVEHPFDKAKALIAAFEGAILLTKLDKNPVHVEHFYTYAFDQLTINKEINS